MSEFPDAEYLILSSRLIPDRDGGYALATLARNAVHLATLLKANPYPSE